MSAEILRRAAAEMRSLAAPAAATEVWDWRSEEGQTYWSDATRTGRYIQTWSPTVAFAVAEWLDLMADMLVGQLLYDHSAEIERALAVARAYLGES